MKISIIEHSVRNALWMAAPVIGADQFPDVRALVAGESVELRSAAHAESIARVLAACGPWQRGVGGEELEDLARHIREKQWPALPPLPARNYPGGVEAGDFVEAF